MELLNSFYLTPVFTTAVHVPILRIIDRFQ